VYDRCCVVADEDFVISDDDVDLRELSSEGSEGPGRRRRGSVDSDFVADEDESGSDWESAAKKPVKAKVSKGDMCVKCKCKKRLKMRIALHCNCTSSTWHQPAIWDNTVLPATQHVNAPHRNPSQ